MLKAVPDRAWIAAALVLLTALPAAAQDAAAGERVSPVVLAMAAGSTVLLGMLLVLLVLVRRQRRELAERLTDAEARLAVSAEEGEALRGQGERLRQINAERNRLLGMAAHDLRGPISLIVGYTKLVLRRELDSDTRTLVEQVDESALLMRKLLDGLLDISRIEAGSLDLERRRTDVVELVRKDVELSRILAAAKEMTIDLEVEDGIPEVSIDPTRIRLVLANLLSNAVKYSFAGSAIQVRLSQGDDEVLLTVRDHGQGIPADEVQSIFQEFQRTSVKATGGEPGTGLGLAIAKKVVEAHSGAIGVWSVVGEGSTFYVSLPFDERPKRLAARLPLRFAQADEGRGGSATVLDLSTAGALLETTVPLEASKRLRFTLILEDDRILTGVATLVREDAPGRYGLRFDAFDEDGGAHLEKYLAARKPYDQGSKA